MRNPSFLRSRFLPLVLAATAGALLNPALQAKAPKILDLNDTVMANRIMTKFAQVVQGSDLGSFLSSRGPFTLFVPTDSAFSKLPPGTLDALLRPENKELLQRIVLFHLVNGQRLTAKDLLPLKTLLSCEGTALTVHTNRSGAQIVMKARILHADIRCANGLIHEIDTVLVPPGMKLPSLTAPPGVEPVPNAAATGGPAGTNAPSATEPTTVPPATPD
jgi:uncharacterized surface protein with fasciclin (FAS1) repeats